MRQGPSQKRGRGRSGGRRGYAGGTSSNRTFDSNGPDVKVRGTAMHIFDKYQVLARDATAAGDRVAAENYLQHAEHYFRIMSAYNAAHQQQANNQNQQPEGDGAVNGRGRGNGTHPAAALDGNDGNSAGDAAAAVAAPKQDGRAAASPEADGGETGEDSDTPSA